MAEMVGSAPITLDTVQVARLLGIDGAITDVWTCDYATKIQFIVSASRTE